MATCGRTCGGEGREHSRLPTPCATPYVCALRGSICCPSRGDYSAADENRFVILVAEDPTGTLALHAVLTILWRSPDIPHIPLLDYDERSVVFDLAGWENRVRLALMASPTTWVQRSLLRKRQSRLFHHVGGMDDIKCEAVRGGNKGTPTGAARQARAPQRFQLEPAHREHHSIEVVAPGKAPFGKTHNPTVPVSGLTSWG